METILVQSRSPRLPVQDPQFWQKFSIAEKYFYIVLCHLLKKYGDEQGRVTGHDTITHNGVPSFQSFHISQRICKGARKKLQDDKLITLATSMERKGTESAQNMPFARLPSERIQRRFMLVFSTGERVSCPLMPKYRPV